MADSSGSARCRRDGVPGWIHLSQSALHPNGSAGGDREGRGAVEPEGIADLTGAVAPALRFTPREQRQRVRTGCIVSARHSGQYDLSSLAWPQMRQT